MAAALLAASAFAACAARAGGPVGAWRDAERPGAIGAMIGRSWVELEAGSVSIPTAASFGRARTPRVQLAGATLRNLAGWSASLFVTRAAADSPLDEEAVRLPDSTAVNARLARYVGHGATLTFDVFNLFDRRASPLDGFVASQRWASPGMPEDFLVHPGEPRGIRLGVRWTFR